MRVWDIKPQKLCRHHLLGEHREVHAIWSILVKNKKGYSRHPEVLRWKGRLASLYARHLALVKELSRRGYQHRSNFNYIYATGLSRQRRYVDSRQKQIMILREKRCGCRV